MTDKGPDRTRRSGRPKPYLWTWLVTFCLAALSTAYLSFNIAKEGTASIDTPPATSFTARGSQTPALVPSGTPSSIPSPTSIPLPAPDPWDGASRVTILVMGLDYRDWEAQQGPPRSDTMILLTVDPLTRTAGVLSIPRDLWVTIPGMKNNKINTAYRFGELYRVPGGGPGLAMKTVEGLLGVPINFYAVIDFSSFERFIDEIGGVDIDVPEEITVDPLGPGNTMILQPGKQHLDGPTALAYARNRHTEGGVFDRAQRQLEVIYAIRDRILSLDMLPRLVLKAPVLYKEINAGIRTNLTLEQAIKLAWLAQLVPEKDIKTGMIGTKQVLFATSEDGQAIFLPVPNRIRQLRDEIFQVDGIAAPDSKSLSLQERMQAEKPQIILINSSGDEAIGERTRDYLNGQGLQVLQVVPGEEVIYDSKVIDHSGKPYSIQYLVNLMGIQATNISNKYEASAKVDIELNLGRDWARKNPMP